MPYVVGLTGGIGSGKSAAASEFERLGVEVVDTDAIAHQLTAPGGAALPAIRERFGEEVIAKDGSLDRGKMRARVFSDPQARLQLEALLHPLIRAESARRVAASRSPYVIHMVPLLVEAKDYRARYDRILVVDCPEALQVQRASARSAMDESEVRRIMAAQVPRAVRVAAADDVIDNSGSLGALRKQVQQLHTLYASWAKK